MTVDLVPTWRVGDVELTEYPFSVDRDSAVEIGEPSLVVESVESLLADGDLERVVRHGNRTYVIPIYIEGADLADLATSEALLRREIQRTGLELTHNPGDDFSPTSIYEVRTAALTPSRSDVYESHLTRKFTLTLTCAPFPRSADLTKVEALAVGSGAEVVLDTCDSATGWEAFVNGDSIGPADPAWLGISGSVWSYDIGIPGPQSLALKRTGTFSVVDRPYIRVNIRANEPLLTTASAVIDGATRDLTLISQRKSPTSADGHEFVFSVPPGSASVTSLTVANYSYADASAFGVSEVAHRGAPSSSSHQVTRILEVGGTERTPASIHVEPGDGASDLGITVVHTSPEDGSSYSPPLRRWRVAGGSVVSTMDPGPFSGERELITPSFHAKVPTSALPEGGYQIIAILRCPTTTTVPISWDLWTIPPGATTDAERQGNITGKVSYSFTANIWAMVVLAEDVTLPTLRTKAGEVEVFIGAGSGVEIDEAWLFRTDDDCALTYVNVVHKNLWLDSADQSSPVPTVWVGDGPDSRAHPGTLLAGMGAHILHPNGTTVFAATSIAANPKVSAEFYRRWHSNAAE